MSKGAGSGRGTETPPLAVASGTGSHTTAEDDDSGLIDIKNMARSTKRRVTSRLSTETDVEESLLASSRPSALRDVVLPDPDKALPVKLATESDEDATDGERKGGTPWIALAAAVVLLGGGAAAWFATRGGGEDDDTRAAASEQTVAQADNLAASAGGGDTPDLTEGEMPEPGSAIADPDTEPGAGEDTDPAPPAEPELALDPEPDNGKTSGTKKVARADRRGKKADRKPDKKRPEKKSKKDAPKKTAKVEAPKGDLDSLLDRAAGEKRDKKADKKADEKPAAPKGKTKLSRNDVQKGMRSVKGRVAACYERFKQPGTVKVKVTISNTGVVTKANATGKFKGTDTGACVSKAVTTATFPEYNGPSMSLSYPFLLQ